jgi:hypothetical protein
MPRNIIQRSKDKRHSTGIKGRRREIGPRIERAVKTKSTG